MPSEVLIKEGTALVFGVSASFNPADDGTNWAIGHGDAITHALTLTGLATGTGARQSIKADLGATRAPEYAVLGCVDFTGETPTSGGTVDYYWAPSTSGTGASGNLWGNSGADAAAGDGAVPSGVTLAEFLRECIYIGTIIVTDDAAVQNGFVGVFSPPTRYGQLVVVNNSGDAFEADDVEMHQVMIPLIPEGQ